MTHPSLIFRNPSNGLYSQPNNTTRCTISSSSISTSSSYSSSSLQIKLALSFGVCIHNACRLHFRMLNIALKYIPLTHNSTYLMSSSPPPPLPPPSRLLASNSSIMCHPILPSLHVTTLLQLKQII